MNNDHCTACALALTFFGRLFGQEPDADFFNGLKSEKLLDAWPLGVASSEGLRGLELLRQRMAGYDAAGHAALTSEYEALFVAPADAIPLWESVWTTKERLLFDGPTFDVRAAYAEYGLSSPRPEHEPDDQIGLELCFLGGVLDRAATTSRAGNSAEAERHLAAARDFYAQHPKRWIFEFLRATEGHPAAAFYAAAAPLCADTLRQTEQLLDLDAA